MALLPDSPAIRRAAPVLALLLAPLLAHGQATLTLEEALRMARERNGTVRAAVLDIHIAEARVQQARSAFFPTITPSFRYNSSRRELGGGSFIEDEGATTQISSNWRILDSGERQLSLLASQRSAEAQQFAARQILRSTLFTVHQQYFDTLRFEELLRVAEQQSARTQLILDQTIARVEVGDVAEKDVLQARADALNARVDVLQSRNRITSAEADLKASIGWDTTAPLPELARYGEPEIAALPPLETLVQEGIARRPDLVAARRRIESLNYSARRADREASITFGLDASYDLQLTPDTLSDRTLTFLATYPLFDGGRARAAAREARLGVAANRADLVQAEREARAEIETAYSDVTQNIERVQAAKLAVEAARLNYTAAVESQRAGAEGTSVITVSTAQVSLVTAESNYIEALYDYYIADVRLRLATGQPVPGEVVLEQRAGQGPR